MGVSSPWHRETMEGSSTSLDPVRRGRAREKNTSAMPCSKHGAGWVGAGSPRRLKRRPPAAPQCAPRARGQARSAGAPPKAAPPPAAERTVRAAHAAAPPPPLSSSHFAVSAAPPLAPALHLPWPSAPWSPSLMLAWASPTPPPADPCPQLSPHGSLRRQRRGRHSLAFLGNATLRLRKVTVNAPRPKGHR